MTDSDERSESPALGEPRPLPHEKEVSELTRPSESWILRWFVLEGDRLHVTAAIQFGILLSLLVLGTVWQIELLELITERQAVQQLFITMLSGVILLVSIVVSINSVVLTQEVTSLGTQHEEIEASREFRRGLEEYSESGVPPVGPGAFLEYVLLMVHQAAGKLGEAAADNPNEDARAEIATLLDDIDEQIEQVHYTIQTAEGSVSNVLLAGINYEYSRQIHRIRQFRRQYDDTLSEDEQECLDHVIEALSYLGSAREYLKTLFLKNELATFSVHLLYVALPVIIFTSYVLLAIDAGIFTPQLVPGIPRLMLAISVAYTVALIPFTLLTVYVIRVASVSRRSLATGPFLLRSGEEWEQEAADVPDDSG